ncbi:hypothetical protein [Sphaerisporangium aureirubrum]|uniref:DUF302 domain-containing protein n=1 Tax=Sphaerisporangium aureirubrum TaxID=1544736 RepID=A0ABW1N8T7_9ACTN
MISFEDIGDRRARAHLEALTVLQRTLTGARLRCLIVERVRLVLPRKFGPRVHLPPYMEVHGKVGLLATVSVFVRKSGKLGFTVTRPSAVPALPAQVKDAEAVAAHILASVVPPGDERLPVPSDGQPGA